MQPLDGITLTDPGFVLQGDRDGVRVWHTPQGDGMGLYFYALPPNIGADLNNLQDVRNFCRSAMTTAYSGLIEADVVMLDGCRALRSIVKQPQEGGGMIYLGSLILPFRDFSYVVKAQCAEQGVTGLREAMILDAMLGTGQIDTSRMKDGRIPGWWQDPYDPRVQSPVMRNLAEDPHYDAQFPDHPLSRARAALGQVQASLRIAPEVKAAPPFVFPPGASHSIPHTQ